MSVLDKLDALAVKKLQHGRNVILGYPVDVDAQGSDVDRVEMHAVDEDATRGLTKELRARGLTVKFHRPSGEIVVTEGARRRG